MRSRGRASRAVTPAELAWIAALPATLTTVAAIVLLGPPLGHALLSPRGEAFWREVIDRPEPVEHARYLLALAGAGLLAGLIVAGARRRLALGPRTIRAAVRTAQGVLAAFLILCVLAQHDVLLRAYVPSKTTPDQIFTWPTLAVSAALAAALVALWHDERVVRRVRALRETPRARLLCAAAAVALTALWLSTAVQTDATVVHSPARNLLPWDASETWAVLDGRSPLVDFHAQYAHLWPYAAAALMALLGSATLTAWTTIMAAISAVAALAIYGTFRRVAARSALALALYVPFLAMSFFLMTRARVDRYSAAAIFSLWPLRFAGPYLLAWLTARHLDGAAPRRTWPLLLVGGLVALNNVELGAGALAATLAAIAWTRRPASPRAWARLVGTAAAGVAGAAALVCALTLARAGQLPRFGLLLEFPRIYAIGGWVLEPMPAAGLHLALYATFAAALAVATVRALRGGEDPVLTGMLAWSGVFGLVAGGYYAGRSDQVNLIVLFSPWYLSLLLLAVVALRAPAAAPARRRVPDAGTLALLFALGLAICALPQIPAPWSQVARLERGGHARPYAQPDGKAFVARIAARGEKVAILIPFGHRIAYDLGLVNVAPYSGGEAIPTREQLLTSLAVARRERVRAVFLDESLPPEADAVVTRAGLRLVARQGPLLAFAER